jgi:integrase
VVPHLGSLPMVDVRREHVDAMVAALRQRQRWGRNLRPAAIAEVCRVVRTMFDMWQEYGRPLPYGHPVPANPVRVPARRHADPLTPGQVLAWRDALPGHMRLMVDVQRYTGCRQSEVRGLRAEDVTFAGRDVTVPLAEDLARVCELPPDRYAARRVTLRFGRALDPNAHPVPIKNDKGYRELPLAGHVAAALAEHMRRFPPVDGWLFTTRPFGYGRPRNPDRVTRTTGVCSIVVDGVACGRPVHGRGLCDMHWQRWRFHGDPLRGPTQRPYRAGPYLEALRKAAVRAGVPLTLHQVSHALRHHCVSVLRDQGFSDQAIGDWIGDSARTVQQVYGRPMPGTTERIAASLASMEDHVAAVVRLRPGA